MILFSDSSLIDRRSLYRIYFSSYVGNVAAGVIVRTMGFPIKLVCSVTVNDIVARAHHDGDFSIVDVVQASLAPAMDIQVNTTITDTTPSALYYSEFLGLLSCYFGFSFSPSYVIRTVSEFLGSFNNSVCVR